MHGDKQIGKMLLALFAIFTTAAPAFANDLALGADFKQKKSLIIPSVAPQAFNFLTKREILEKRCKLVSAQKSLLRNAYKPDEAIFGGLEDNKPWWGTLGDAVYTPGQHAIDGPARQSAYILNPFRLISAEPNIIGIWNLNALKPGDVDKSDFPADWTAGPVIFSPAQHRAEVTYNVTKFNNSLHAWQDKLKNAKTNIANFSFIAYNARDFGYHWAYLSPHQSPNIHSWRAWEPVQITQMLHCGGSCGYPGGCNNMSPQIPTLDYNSLTGLPAHATILLWKEEPDKISQPPDMTFVVNFI